MYALLQDSWIKARIDAAVAPYHNLVSPDDLAFMRDELAELLVRDERAARLLRRALPREDVDTSGEAFVGRWADDPPKKSGRAVGE
ncbi:MAG TPA: hypothetical protein PK156_37040 [Polyangium sp.]|nr:hypothetical protein [Polyangium sp.]